MAGLRKASVLSVALLVVTVAAGFLGGVAWQKGQVASVQAEDADDDQRRDRSERRMVIDEVGLEPGKRAEVEEIIRHFMIQMRSLHEEFEPVRARMQALNDEFEEAYRPRQRDLFRQTRDSIKSILAPDERTLYDSLLAVRYGDGDRGRGGSGGGQPRGRPDEGGAR